MMRKQIVPGLHFAAFNGSEEEVNNQLREWLFAEEPVQVVNQNSGYAGGEWWVSVVYMHGSTANLVAPQGALRQ